MARATTQQEVFWPAPIQGMVTEVSYVQEPVQFARFLRNAVVSAGGISRRDAQVRSVQFDITPVSGHSVIWFDFTNDQYLFTDGSIHERDGSTYASSFASVSNPDEATFLDQLFLFPGTAVAPLQRNGATSYGAFNYTLATLANSELRGGEAYKGRIYFWGTDASASEQVIEYGGLLAKSGNTEDYAVTAFLKAGEAILFCRAVTVEAGLQTGQVFVVYGDKGTVLVFDGETPATWVLSGRYNMTPPISKYAWVPVEGDIVIAGQEDVYSTRALFNAGTQAVSENSMIKPIQSLYRQLMRNVTLRFAQLSNRDLHAFYLIEHNAIVINLGFASQIMESDDAELFALGLGTNTRRVQLVYFRDTQSWALWDIPQLNWPIRRANLNLGFDNNPGGSATYYQDQTMWTEGYNTLCYGSQISQLVDHLGNTDGTLLGSDAIELTWTTPILTARQYQNAHVHGVRAFFAQEKTTAEAQLSALGVIGNGGDLTFDTNTGYVSYLRDDSSSISKKSVTQVKATAPSEFSIRQLFAPVALQEFFWAATLRLNKLGVDSVDEWETTNTYKIDIFGMTVYFTPGGIF